jgi:hypothetical protein
VDLLEGTQTVPYTGELRATLPVVTLGRFDIACAIMTMTMSQYRTAPRKEHLALLGHVFGYLRKYPDGAIRF